MPCHPSPRKRSSPISGFAWCLALLASLLLSLPAIGQVKLFDIRPQPLSPEDKTQVEVKALFSMASPSGYLPVRVSIVNNRKNSGEVQLRTRSRSGSGDEDSEFESSFSVEAKPGTTSIRDLLVPLTTKLNSGGYGSTAVSIRASGTYGSDSGNVPCDYAPDAPALLMSEQLHTPNASTIDAELDKLTGGYGSPSFAARFDPSEMPEDWRAYSGYDGMLLTDDDWQLVDPGARAAILHWCRMGGELHIHTLNDSTSLATLGIDERGPGDNPNWGDSGYGFGSIIFHEIDAAQTLDPAKALDTFLKIPTLNGSIQHDYSNRWPLHLEFGGQAFSYGIFIVVLIAFGILVGPVNLFVFAKSGKRHKLFITTPIISLATSALLIFLILLKDGVGGRGSRISLIEVRPDIGENSAYVLQEQISRTGVLLGGSFEIDEDATLSPLSIASSPWARLTPSNGGGGSRYRGELEDGKLSISGDWFQSRSEQGQLIRAKVPTRGRIEIKSKAGPPALLSTFEFPINKLYYVDPTRGCWMVEDLQPGTSKTATLVSRSDYDAAVADQSIRLGERHRSFLIKTATRADHYIAITSEAPGIESLDSIRWQSTDSILTGPVLR